METAVKYRMVGQALAIKILLPPELGLAKASISLDSQSQLEKHFTTCSIISNYRQDDRIYAGENQKHHAAIESSRDFLVGNG
jgi:hypothetical protein